MDKGWISIHRKLKDHWIYKDNRVFSKFEAWIDILLEVNHSEVKTVIKETLFTVKRGESINSLDTWARRWNWNKSKVRRFLKLLQNDSMIELKNEHKTTRLTVCNYDSYQSQRNADETDMKRKRNADETQMTPNNNVNKENKENNTFNFDKLLSFINQKTGRKFKTINDKVKKKYKARLKEGYTKEDILNSIINASNLQYHKENGCQYLTPEFFSRQETLDKYGNEAKGNLIASFHDPVN